MLCRRTLVLDIDDYQPRLGSAGNPGLQAALPSTHQLMLGKQLPAKALCGRDGSLELSLSPDSSWPCFSLDSGQTRAPFWCMQVRQEAGDAWLGDRALGFCSEPSVAPAQHSMHRAQGSLRKPRATWSKPSMAQS